MVLQPAQATYSGSQSLEASSCVAQSEAKIAQLKEALRQRQLFGVATGLVAQRSAIISQPDWTLAADNADENSGAPAQN